MRSKVAFWGAALTALAVVTCAKAQDAPKRLTANDLAVETHKWDDKRIQTIVQCFYADVDEYRCGILNSSGGLTIGNTFVRVDFMAIAPPEMKKAVEDNCDTVDKMASRACRFQVIFTYSGNDLKENLDGTSMMTIVAQGFAGEFSHPR